MRRTAVWYACKCKLQWLSRSNLVPRVKPSRATLSRIMRHTQIIYFKGVYGPMHLRKRTCVTNSDFLCVRCALYLAFGLLGSSVAILEEASYLRTALCTRVSRSVSSRCRSCHATARPPSCGSALLVCFTSYSRFSGRCFAIVAEKHLCAFRSRALDLADWY